MSTREINSIGNPFARTLPVPQKKQIQPPVQKVDTTREDIKKRLLESFESQSDVVENAKYSSEQLAAELENMIYELTGKNSKDKSYREKSKKIMSRLKGARNSQLRLSLRLGNMTIAEFSKLSDRQLDDDSYFDKLFNNGNTTVVETKKSGTRPPNIRSIPVKKIDLTTSFSEGVNDYFDNINSNPVNEEPHEKEKENAQNIEAESDQTTEPKLAIFSEENIVGSQQQVDNNFPSISIANDESSKNEITIENEQSYEKNTPIVSQENKPFEQEFNRFSPKDDKKSIQFNPIIRNQNNNTAATNQTFYAGSNRPNFVGEKEEEITNLNIGMIGKPHNKLEELKELMQKHKQIQKNTTRTAAGVMDQSFSSSNALNNTSEIGYEDQKKIPTELDTNHIHPKKEIHPSGNDLHTQIQTVNDKKHDVLNSFQFKKIEPVKIKKVEENSFNNISNKRELENEPKTLNPQVHEPVQNKVEVPFRPNNLTQSNFYEEMEKEFNDNKVADEKETKLVTENLKEKLDSRYISPRNETRSNYSHLRLRNYYNTIDSKEPSIASVRDRYKTFGESKATLEINMELANKKCEIYEKEITNLRQTLNDLKLQLSRTNEDSHKIEISRLKQNLNMKEKENQILIKENNTLKKQIKTYEENTNQLIEDNKSFRLEAEKKFSQYNKEMESLMNKLKEMKIQKDNDQVIDRTEDKRQNEYEKKEIITHIKSEAYANDLNDHSSKINFPLNSNANTYNIKENETKEEEKSQHINVTHDPHQVDHYDNYYHNNFTNGNPNIIEEVGADNYLNMNGNTYDEMKDVRYEVDNLQDHQYYDNTFNLPCSINTYSNQAFDTIETENIPTDKTANTGENFNNFSSGIILNANIDNNKAESGATNNIFINAEEKEEVENVLNANDVFDSMNTSLNIEKHMSVQSTRNSNMHQSSLLQPEIKQTDKFENKPLEFNKPANVTIQPPKKMNPIAQQVKAPAKPVINKTENVNKYNSLFDDVNDNSEISIFNTKPAKSKVEPVFNKHTPINNMNKVNHVDSNSKKILLNDNPFDNFNNEENIWETISNHRDNANNIFD